MTRRAALGLLLAASTLSACAQASPVALQRNAMAADAGDSTPRHDG